MADCCESNQPENAELSCYGAGMTRTDLGIEKVKVIAKAKETITNVWGDLTMKKLQILGTGYPKCKKLTENAEATAKALCIEYELEKINRHQRDHEVRCDDDTGPGCRRSSEGRGQGADR